MKYNLPVTDDLSEVVLYIEGDLTFTDAENYEFEFDGPYVVTIEIGELIKKVNVSDETANKLADAAIDCADRYELLEKYEEYLSDYGDPY